MKLTAKESRDFIEWARQMCFISQDLKEELAEIQAAIVFIKSLDKKYKSCKEVKELQSFYALVKNLRNSYLQAQQTIGEYIGSLKAGRKQEYLTYYVMQYKTDKEINDDIFFYADAATVYQLKRRAALCFEAWPTERTKKIKNNIANAEEKIFIFLSEHGEEVPPPRCKGF